MPESRHRETWRGQKVTRFVNRYTIQSARWEQVGFPGGSLWAGLYNQATANLLDFVVVEKDPNDQAVVNFRQLAQLGQPPSFVEWEGRPEEGELWVRRNVADQVAVVEAVVPGWGQEE